MRMPMRDEKKGFKALIQDIAPVSELQVLNWDPSVHGFKGQRKMRPYGKQEGVMGARNSWFVCGEHQAHTQILA
jgi:hypothetical protein